MSVYDKVARQRRFYETGASRSLSVRRKALKRLEVAIRCNEKWIRQALWADLNKSDTEAYMMEIGQVLSEISYALRHMKEWSRVEKVHTSMAQKPGRAYKKPGALRRRTNHVAVELPVPSGSSAAGRGDRSRQLLRDQAVGLCAAYGGNLE